MRVGILGSGLMGGKLGTLFARAGHDVVFSYARDPKKLDRLAREAKGNAQAGTPRDAAHAADAGLLAALAAKAPGIRVVSAFGTVPSEVLFGVFETRNQPRRPSLVYCGDDSDAKEVAARLIRDVGFDPVDAGPLRIARYLEPFTLLMGQLAYEGDRGPELAYRLEWFGPQSESRNPGGA